MFIPLQHYFGFPHMILEGGLQPPRPTWIRPWWTAINLQGQENDTSES